MSFLNEERRRRLQQAWAGTREYIARSGLSLCPLLPAVRKIRRADVAADLAAGASVALLTFPLGMAYALIAGLPIELGIFGSVVAGVVGSFFSGGRFIMYGPSNATAVLIFALLMNMNATDGERLAALPTLLLLTGLFLVLAAVFRVTTLLRFVSRSVIAGYITAAAVYIIANQIRQVMGVQIVLPPESALFDILRLTLMQYDKMHLPSLLLAGLTALVYLQLGRVRPKWPNVALTLVAVSMVGAVADGAMRHFLPEIHDFLGGTVRHLEAVQLDHWDIGFPEIRWEWVRELAGASMVVAFLCLLEGASIGKSMAARAGEALQLNQEALAMGFANLGCALAGGMPSSGSLTRSQLAADSGARTALTGIVSGVLCLAGAGLLGPLLRFVPLPALGVLVFFIGVGLFNRTVVRIVTHSTRSDAAVFYTTLGSALLLRLDFAIILGALLSIILFLRKAGAPELVEYGFSAEGQLHEISGKGGRTNPQISIVHVEGDLFFGAAELFQEQIRLVCGDPNLRIVVLRLKNAYHLDATSVLALYELVKTMRDNGRDLIVSGARRDVYRVFRDSGLLKELGPRNFFMASPANPNVSTRNALKRAQEILGGEQADVRIYYDPQQQPKKQGSG